MDPYDERRMRNEVIYLHALWQEGPPRQVTHHHSLWHHHQGPPPGPAPPQHNQPSPLNYSSSTRLLHHPSNPTQFKNGGSKRKGIDKKKDKVIQLLSQSPGKEWPCNPSPPASSADWNPNWLKFVPDSLLVSPEGKAKLAANHAQSKALSLTKDYLFITGDEKSDDDSDDMEKEDDQCEYYKFFVNLFAEDKGLSEFYSKNKRNGEFLCLVCGGLGKKLAGKKYKGCVALVQHSISIANTENKVAHRAYGRAICEVLAWDINNLSSIVSAMAGNQEQPPNDACQADAGTTENVRDARPYVSEGDKDSSASIQTKECSASASDMVEGEAHVIVDEGPDNGSAIIECKEGEGSLDVTISGQGELCDKKCNAEESVGEVTENSSTDLESKEGPVDACNDSILPTNKSCSGGNSAISGESTLIQQNSGSEAAGCKTSGGSDLTVAVTVGGIEDATFNHELRNSGSEAAGCKMSGGSDLTVAMAVGGTEDGPMSRELEPSKDGSIVANDAIKTQECPS